MKLIRVKQFFVKCVMTIFLALAASAGISQTVWTTPTLNGLATWFEDTPVRPSNDATFIGGTWLASGTGMTGGPGTTMSLGISAHGTITYYQMTNISTGSYLANVAGANDYISAQVTIASSLPCSALRIFKSEISSFWADGVNSGSYLLSLAASDVTGGVPFVPTATPIFKDVQVNEPGFGVDASLFDPIIGSPSTFLPFVMVAGHTYEFRWYVSYSGSAGTGIIKLDNPKLYIQTGNIVVPVTLTSFDAKIKNCSTEISWATDIEDNFNYFEVEKSADGNNYSPVARIAAKGDKSIYNYTDLTPGTNRIFYRLKMTDKAGSYKYSVVKIVVPDCLTKVTVTNPVHDNLLIQGLKSGEKIVIRDVNGNIVINKTVINTTEQISMTGYPAGLYLISLFESADASPVRTEKFVKL